MSLSENNDKSRSLKEDQQLYHDAHDMQIEVKFLKIKLDVKAQCMEKMRSRLMQLQKEVHAEITGREEYHQLYDLLQNKICTISNDDLEANEEKNHLAELQGEIIPKEAELEKFKQEKKDLDKTFVGKPNSNRLLQTEVEVEIRELTELRDTLKKRQSEEERKKYEKMKLFQSTLASVDYEINLLKAENNNVGEENSSRSDELAAIKSDIDSKKLEVNAIKLTITKNEEEFVCKKNKFAEVQSQLDRLKVEFALLQKQIANEQEEICDARKADDELTAEIKSKIGEVSSLEVLKLELRKEFIEVDNELNLLKEECKALREKKITNEAKLKKMKETKEKRRHNDRKRKLLDSSAVENDKDGFVKPSAILRPPKKANRANLTLQTADSSVAEWSTFHDTDSDEEKRKIQAREQVLKLYKRYF